MASAVRVGAEALVAGVESRAAPSADALDAFSAAMHALRAFVHASGSSSVTKCAWQTIFSFCVAYA